jgi:CRISPR-associated protein Cas1
MYGVRLGEIVPSKDLNVLRGIEGARVKASYKLLAGKFDIKWYGRKYDRANPLAADVPNQAINHAAVAVRAGAALAVAVSGALPELGFIHEDSSLAFALDIADLYRETVTVPIAFGCAKDVLAEREDNLERLVRKRIGQELRKGKLVAKMIDRIKDLLDADDADSDL